jgi:hypothetical protein
MPNVNRKGRTERIERFVRYRNAGVPVCDAIRLALSPNPNDRDLTKRAIPAFAERHGLDPKNTAAAIYGSSPWRVSDDVCVALASELGETAEFWKSLLSPAREAAASA